MINRYFSGKTPREHKTNHNSGSWPPLEIKSSALDRIFHAVSNGKSFKTWNVKTTMKKVGPDKKKRARENGNRNTMFWPLRTTWHSRFGMCSHRSWSPTRLKKVSYKQKNQKSKQFFRTIPETAPNMFFQMFPKKIVQQLRPKKFRFSAPEYRNRKKHGKNN